MNETELKEEKEQEEKEEKLFIHKYQPFFISDFGFDKDLIDVINTLIDMDNLNILFVGDIGSGKTSLINSVIREYYKTNSSQEENILSINSLKDQGINYYRNDVKTFCQTCTSVPGKKRIVVLDDLDFMNEQSQQVFRNSIDKHSKNVHFISSCTNVQKLIESLQSRFIIIKMKPLKRENLEKIMNSIKESENIVIHKEAESFILNVCNNTVKILINYMEKFKLLNEPITMEIAKNICTNISFNTFEDYTNCLVKNELVNALNIIYSVYEKGYSVMDILDNYFAFVKLTSLFTETEKYNVIPIICKYISFFHNIHEDEIELSLFTNNLIQILETKNKK